MQSFNDYQTSEPKQEEEDYVKPHTLLRRGKNCRTFQSEEDVRIRIEPCFVCKIRERNYETR